MRFKTWNTEYTLQDRGDGGFMISGSPRFCPTPLLVRLAGEVVVGRRVIFTYINPKDNPCPQEGNSITTTPVVSVHES